jgi:5-methylcytosine-specific restriction endonuclease McrA
VLHLLTTGELTLTTVCLLGRHLTDDNHRDLLKAVGYKSKREVEHLIAALRPRPDVTPMIRRLPTPTEPAPRDSSKETTALITLAAEISANTASRALLLSAPDVRVPAAHRTVIAPLAATRYKVQFTVGQATHDKLRHAQELLRHVVPNGDPAEIFDRALTLLVQHLEKAKLAAARRPGRSRSRSPRSRRIPSDVRRAVWKRDGGQCAFVGRSGRCSERGFLEFHHVVPYARGGTATEENIQLRCRAHNRYEAEQEFGRTMVRERPIPYSLDSVRTELSAGSYH